MKDKVIVTRKTTESKMRVCLDFSGLKSDYRSKINTPFEFFSHLLEHIAWRSGANIELDIELDKFFLKHVVYEDLGITFGKAIREYILANKTEGAVGYGDAIGIIDEAKAEVAISFEERALFAFTSNVEIPTESEDVYSEDIKTFLDGICQGGMCTLHMDIIKGENGHHIWESAFRALGVALGRAFYLDSSRKNMSAGVAGGIEFIIE